MALACLIRVSQSSGSTRPKCISPAMIMVGWPSMKNWWSRASKRCGRPSGATVETVCASAPRPKLQSRRPRRRILLRRVIAKGFGPPFVDSTATASRCKGDATRIQRSAVPAARNSWHPALPGNRQDLRIWVIERELDGDLQVREHRVVRPSARRELPLADCRNRRGAEFGTCGPDRGGVPDIAVRVHDEVDQDRALDASLPQDSGVNGPGLVSGHRQLVEHGGVEDFRAGAIR